MTATLAGLALAVVAAIVAWYRSRARAAADRADRELARADRAEDLAATATATAEATADQLAADRRGATRAKEIRDAPRDPDPVADVRAVDAAARRVRDRIAAALGLNADPEGVVRRRESAAPDGEGA